MNIDRFTHLSQQALAAAQKEAEARSNPVIEPVHLFRALLQEESGTVRSVLEKLKLKNSAESAAERVLKALPAVQGQPGGRGVSGELQRVLDAAESQSRSFGDTVVTVEHLFLAILEAGGSLATQLREAGLRPEQLAPEFRKARGNKKANDPGAESNYQALEKYSKDLTALARAGKLDPVIGRDEEIRRVIQVLSRRTKNNPVLIGEPGVGKTAVAEGLAQRIVKGDVPEGLKDKTIRSLDLGAMVAGAKFRGEFEERLKAFLKEVQDTAGEIILFIDELHTLVGAGKSDGAMDASNLLKPALARGELRCVGATTLDEFRKYIEKDSALERRFQQVFVGEPSVEETISILRGLKEKYEVHHGVRIQDQAIIAAATLSHRYISNRFLPDKAIDLMDEAAAKLRIEIDSMPAEIDEKVRAVTQMEIEREALKKESDPASRARLADIEKSVAEQKSVVDKLKAQWSREKDQIVAIRKLKAESEGLGQELERAERVGDLAKAAELRYGRIPQLKKDIEQAQKALKANGTEPRMLKEEVEAEDIAGIIARWTGIPLDRLLKGENEKLLQLEGSLGKRVRGQDDALRAVADAVRLARSGLKDPSKPIGSFLFLGPTGVGKTETSKALAEFLFDDEQAMVRIDMSEYMEKHSVSRLIGAPPGYVGYDEGGQLTEAVRRRPYSVILMDEIEKAHPDVLNVLLQVLDDGRLTDGQGQVVDFRNTVLIMTSNLGSHFILENVDRSREQIQAGVLEILKQQMRPEFLNRIDEIVVFKSLDRKLIREIVDIQVRNLSKVLADRKLSIELTDAAKDWLADVGYDPLFGARPLKRVVYKEVQVPLSKRLLAGDFRDGDAIRADLSVGGGGRKELSFSAGARA